MRPARSRCSGGPRGGGSGRAGRVARPSRHSSAMEPEREEALQVCEAARGHLVDSRLADERRWSAAVSSPSSSPPDKRRIWLRGHRKIIGDYLIEARAAFAAAAPLNGECGDHSAATTALGLVEAVLELSPRMEAALELRACSLLAFRRYRGVADMLRDYIPSCTKPTCFLCCFDISNLKHRVLADGEAAAHRRRWAQAAGGGAMRGRRPPGSPYAAPPTAAAITADARRRGTAGGREGREMRKREKRGKRERSLMTWPADMWGPRGSHTDLAATSDKTGFKTAE
ncbi:hypothetical protein DAI22_06g221703 [Oryza sativa Japonica Group]|nr:uncharacterized protein LOC107281207 isoform X2 [Oryza sativa Japonica Group]KAF2927662.1 hypothetical protein DAI22_06g221703 [Oryza sativa Japonica Group]